MFWKFSNFENFQEKKDRYILFSTINSMHAYIAKDKPKEKKEKEGTQKKI